MGEDDGCYCEYSQSRAIVRTRWAAAFDPSSPGRLLLCAGVKSSGDGRSQVAVNTHLYGITSADWGWIFILQVLKDGTGLRAIINIYSVEDTHEHYVHYVGPCIDN